MRCQNRNIHLHQSRSSNRRCNNIVSSSRNAHTKDQRRDHCKEHCRQQVSTCKIKQCRSQFKANACFGYNTDNDSGCSTGNQNTENTFRTFDQAFDYITKADTCRFSEAGTDQSKTNRPQSSTHRCITGYQQVNDDRQR